MMLACQYAEARLNEVYSIDIQGLMMFYAGEVGAPLMIKE
jgi:hypothetical protein